MKLLSHGLKYSQSFRGSNNTIALLVENYSNGFFRRKLHGHKTREPQVAQSKESLSVTQNFGTGKSTPEYVVSFTSIDVKTLHNNGSKFVDTSSLRSCLSSRSYEIVIFLASWQIAWFSIFCPKTIRNRWLQSTLVLFVSNLKRVLQSANFHPSISLVFYGGFVLDCGWRHVNAGIVGAYLLSHRLKTIYRFIDQSIYI